MLESLFQAKLIKEVKKRFDGCIILKNDSNYLQGFPDLLILFEDKWAALECKSTLYSPYQPNQVHYINMLSHMSFAAVICPENKEDVLNDLQQAFGINRPSCISRR